MERKEWILEYAEYAGLDDCPQAIMDLYPAAVEAAERAYAPFSAFRVGVAVEMADGTVYQGSNQENKAYPSGLCAERTALFYVNSLKPDVPVVRMVLLAFDQNGLTSEPVYPCGSCRQVMVESEDRVQSRMEIWMIGKNRIHQVQSAASLLPFKFHFNH